MALSNGLVANDHRANLIRAFKASGCVVCKRRYPELDWSELHVDHIDPRDKPRASQIPGSRGVGGNRQIAVRGATAEILVELLDCQVLCRECHVAKHRNGNSDVRERQLVLFSGSGGWGYAG